MRAEAKTKTNEQVGCGSNTNRCWMFELYDGFKDISPVVRSKRRRNQLHSPFPPFFSVKQIDCSPQTGKMETSELAGQLLNLQTPNKEKDLEIEEKPCHKSRVIPSRCTRSQVSVEWTLQEMLILVNEVSTVEGDCLKVLPSYQKWKIIADRCTALDVVRSLNQCRSKWDSLLVEYKKIKEWGSHTVIDSYWSLESKRKSKLGLPSTFDRELFRLIDDFVKAQDDRSDTDPGTDLEEPDVLELLMDTGLKKRRRKCGSRKSKVAWEKEMATKLHENAELTFAIVKGDLSGNTDNRLADMKNQTTFARQQGDELIKILGSIAGTLDQISNLIQ
ncbi:hypothetical protein NE237_022128 [Protea cynaroides]|uniref:Myb-like domain-containing protein n=1 Tax=Protea cynaroides TaxID=273540 RepID=A0A9Q0HAD1_9MAGN|nr:hypothetical protein NE237_022128 [Protea cynaroides]